MTRLPASPPRQRPTLAAAAVAVACMLALAAGCERAEGGDPRATAAGNGRPATVAAPTRFEASDNDAGVALPADIVRALSSDARVLDCPEGTDGSASRFAPDWVIARRVDLDDDGRDDWVVRGRHGCLAADGAADWWLYADDGMQRRLLLAADRARAVELQASRSNRFRDVVLHRDGGAVRATYQGAAYVLPERPTAGSSAGDAPTPGAERFAAPTGGARMDVQTVAGRLEIAPAVATSGGDAHVVRLDGRELLRTGADGAFADFPLPRLLARFGALAPFDEVLVFQQHMYGNACSGGPLWILGLRRGAAPVRSGAIDYCGGADPEIEARGAALLVTLPGAPASGVHAGQAPQRWEFSDGELRRLHTP